MYTLKSKIIIISRINIDIKHDTVINDCSPSIHRITVGYICIFREKIRNISSSGKLQSVQRALDEAHEGGSSGPPSLSSLGSSGMGLTSSQMPSLHCSQGGTPLRFLLREDNVTSGSKRQSAALNFKYLK